MLLSELQGFTSFKTAWEHVKSSVAYKDILGEPVFKVNGQTVIRIKINWADCSEHYIISKKGNISTLESWMTKKSVDFYELEHSDIGFTLNLKNMPKKDTTVEQIQNIIKHIIKTEEN